MQITNEYIRYKTITISPQGDKTISEMINLEFKHPDILIHHVKKFISLYYYLDCKCDQGGCGCLSGGAIYMKQIGKQTYKVITEYYKSE